MRDVDELTATALLAADGDRIALSAFVRATQADVWRLCAYLVDRDTADDVTQEVYARALAALPDFRADAPARTWLLSITYRTCADQLRRRRRRRLLTERLAALPQSHAQGPTSTVDAALLLDRLPPDERAPLVLTQLLGLRYHEAAEVLGVPIGTIRSRIARARRLLVDVLGSDAAIGSGSEGRE